MGRTKRVLWGFMPLDYKAIEIYLEEMAEKGWMLEKVGLFTGKFRASEPRKIKFHINVFKDGGPLSPENTAEIEEHRKLCEESGWNFITSRDFLQFFYTEEGNPLPIETDDALEQKVIRSTLGKWGIISALLSIFILGRTIPLYLPPKYKFMLSFVGVSGITLPFLFLFIFAPIIYGLFRMVKARGNIKKGLAVEKPSLRGAKIRRIILQVPAIIIFIIITIAFIIDSFYRPKIMAISLIGPVLGVAIGLGLRFLIKKRARDKSDSILYIVFAILGVVVVSAIANSLLSGISMDTSYKKESIPEGYPSVTLTDLSENSQESSLINSEFNASTSPIVPKHYTYSEIWNINGIDQRLYIGYYKTRSPGFAKRIFKGIVAEMRDGIKWRGKSIFQRDITLDENMKDLWDMDHLVLVDDGDEVIMQRGNTVLRLSANVDFEDRYLRELIIDKFFTQVEN